MQFGVVVVCGVEWCVVQLVCECDCFCEQFGFLCIDVFVEVVQFELDFVWCCVQCVGFGWCGCEQQCGVVCVVFEESLGGFFYCCWWYLQECGVDDFDLFFVYDDYVGCWIVVQMIEYVLFFVEFGCMVEGWVWNGY